jgi:hypothetical protein
VDGQAAIDLERPRSIPELIGTSFSLYFRVPFLFLALAAVVVIPWEFGLLLITGDGPLALGGAGFITSNLVTLSGYFLAIPLISAFHVQAVREVGDGGRPRLIPTSRRSLPALPVVALATGISGAAITVGYLALAVPGLLLTVRWPVVAQTAALDGGGWTDALRRSADLTKGHRWHVLWLLLVAGLITLVPWLGLRAALGHTTTTVGSFAAGTALQIVTRSFEALVSALLYFDLKARLGGSMRTAGMPKPLLREWQELRRTDPAPPAMATDEHTGHSLDPEVYTDEGRPPGWYVDPDRPWLMRYWRTGEHQGWSKETTKTPEKAQGEWRDLRWRR